MSRRSKNEFDDPAMNNAASKIFAALNPMTHMPSNNPAFKFLTIVLTVAIFGAIIWYSYPKERSLQDGASIPIIKAQKDAFRIKPKDEGGMDVLFGESTVFDSIASDSNKSERRIENLLSEDEEPLSRQAIFAGMKTELNTDPQTQELQQTEMNETKTEATSQEPSKETIKAQRIQLIPAEKAQAEKVVAAPPTKPISKPQAQTQKTKVEKKASSAGSYYVQLGSLQTEKDAKAAWSTFQNQYTNLLNNASYRINKKVIENKGTFYRLQAGGFSQEQANSTCQKIKDKFKGGCFVIKD